jgi:hypothetical protein
MLLMKLSLCFDGRGPGSKKSKEAVMSPMVGTVRVCVGGSLELGGWFCVLALGRNLAS